MRIMKGPMFRNFFLLSFAGASEFRPVAFSNTAPRQTGGERGWDGMDGTRVDALARSGVVGHGLRVRLCA